MTELTEKKKHDICIAAIEAKKDIEWKFIELGKMLYTIKNDRLYEAGWSSWEEYCMELKLAQPTISKLFRIYEVFVLHYQIEPLKLAEAGGWSSVAELLPLIDQETTTKARVRELLGLATDQPRHDLRKTIADERRGKPCTHKKTRFLILEICDDGCNERWNVTDAYKLTKQ